MQRPAELFFSHAHEDAAHALPIIEVLRRHGIPVWYAPDQLRGAQQWHDEIGKALKRCDWMAVLLSPRSVRSWWVKQEYIYAVDQSAYHQHILPLVLEDCEIEELSWTLGAIQKIDFRSNREAGYRELLLTWGIGYSPG